MSLRRALGMLVVFGFSAVARGSAFPVPLAANPPVGSLIYSGSASSFITLAGQTDSYTLALDAGQTITINVVPDSSLQPTIQLRNPSNAVIATSTAAGAGQEALVQAAPVTTSGTYTIIVGGAGSSTGSYELKVTLNSALENEGHGGPGDDTLATAQDLSATGVSLPGGADRMAVLGHSDGASDFYSFTLAAGQSTTILLSLATNVPVSLELRDSASTVLATGVSGAGNVSLAIHNFVAPAAGTYYVRVAGTGVSDYSLVVLRQADFDFESNDTIAGYQVLGAHVVLGAIGNGASSPDSDYYAFGVNSGDTLHFTTSTPSDGPGEFVNTLNPGIRLYNSGGTLVATGIVLADGRNEDIAFIAAASGTMYIQVLGDAGTTGVYVLTATGNTGTPPPPAPTRSLTAASPAHLWIGLKNSDDQGTQFDLKVELSKNGSVVASGLQRCITGVTRNPSNAKEAVVAFDSFSPVSVTAGDVLALSVSTRIGTNPDNTKCAGHNSAQGLRLYYDSTNRSSRFDATITPDSSKDYYLHSDGTVCGSAQSSGVTTRFLNNTAPTAANPRCKDSGGVSFSGANPFSLIGTWSLAPLP